MNEVVSDGFHIQRFVADIWCGPQTHSNFIIYRDMSNFIIYRDMQCDQIKIAKCLYKLPKNDFTRKMIDFDTFTKIA